MVRPLVAGSCSRALLVFGAALDREADRRETPAAALDEEKRWPYSRFRTVTDPALRAACLTAQDVARALSRGHAAKRWSRREFGRQAGVDYEQVAHALDGTGWSMPYTQARLMYLVGASLQVNEADLDNPPPEDEEVEDPERRPADESD